MYRFSEREKGGFCIYSVQGGGFFDSIGDTFHFLSPSLSSLMECGLHTMVSNYKASCNAIKQTVHKDILLKRLKLDGKYDEKKRQSLFHPTIPSQSVYHRLCEEVSNKCYVIVNTPN